MNISVEKHEAFELVFEVGGIAERTSLNRDELLVLRDKINDVLKKEQDMEKASSISGIIANRCYSPSIGSVWVHDDGEDCTIDIVTNIYPNTPYQAARVVMIEVADLDPATGKINIRPLKERQTSTWYIDQLYMSYRKLSDEEERNFHKGKSGLI